MKYIKVLKNDADPEAYRQYNSFIAELEDIRSHLNTVADKLKNSAIEIELSKQYLKWVDPNNENLNLLLDNDTAVISAKAGSEVHKKIVAVLCEWELIQILEDTYNKLIYRIGFHCSPEFFDDSTQKYFSFIIYITDPFEVNTLRQIGNI